jgi:DNA-binding transcriptional LysR family regulator
VLLEERSVSLAADRLCLSQSATSSALGRLRDYFEDDLLVLKGRQMILTPRAEELIEPVRAVLEQIRTTIAVAQEFDPSTCDRQIRIMASDYTCEVLLTDVINELAHKAPLMRFEIQGMGSKPIDSLERGMIDLLISVDFALASDHPSELLFDDGYIIVGDANNEMVRQGISSEQYFKMGHVTTRFGRSRVPAFEDWFLRKQKQTRQVEVVAPSFMSVPGYLIGTRRIATMHRKLADRLVQYLPLATCPVPFDIPPIREAVQWHVTSKNDHAIQWILGQMRAFTQQQLGSVGPDASGQSGRIMVAFEANREESNPALGA